MAFRIFSPVAIQCRTVRHLIRKPHVSLLLIQKGAKICRLSGNGRSVEAVISLKDAAVMPSKLLRPEYSAPSHLSCDGA
jgi:hypothetical protein